MAAVLDLVPRTSDADELEAAARHLVEVAARLEVSAVTATRCVSLIEVLGPTGNAVAALGSQLARRVAASRIPVPGGGGAADLLARAGGGSTGAALRRLRGAELVEGHPATAEAVASGAVSEAQAAEIARTEDAVPGSEAGLLALARGATLTTVEDEARRIRAAATDPERLRRRQRSLTRLFHRLRDEGLVHIGVDLPPEIGIALLNELDGRAEALRREARRSGGEVLGRDHYRALALLGLIAGPGWGPRVEVVVVAGPDDEPATGTDESGDPGPVWVREPVRRPRRAPGAHGAGAAEASAAEANSAAEEPSADDDDLIGCAHAVVPRPPAHGGCLPQSTGPGDPHLTVVVSVGALRRGTLEEGETCHIVGGGPTAPSLARECLGAGGFLVGVVHDGRSTTHLRRFGRRGRVVLDAGFAALVRASGTELGAVDLAGRRSSAALRSALLLGEAPGYTGAVCSTAGCDRRWGLAFDHRNPVANGGRTRWDNLEPQCWSDHDHKTRADRRDGLFGGVAPVHERNLPRRR